MNADARISVPRLDRPYVGDKVRLVDPEKHNLDFDQPGALLVIEAIHASGFDNRPAYTLREESSPVGVDDFAQSDFVVVEPASSWCIQPVGRELLARAIADPGAFVGYRGERSLTEWQVDALANAIRAEQVKLGVRRSLAEQVDKIADRAEAAGSAYPNTTEGLAALQAATEVFEEHALGDVAILLELVARQQELIAALKGEQA